MIRKLNKRTTNRRKKENTTEEAKAAGNGTQEAAKNETIKLVTVKEPIEYRLSLQFTQPLAGDRFQKSMKKLDEINAVESKRMRLESAFNALESHVIDVQSKLDEDEYSTCIAEDERQKIINECSVISEWLYEDIDNPTPEIYEKKLKDLKALTSVFLGRHWEHAERPEALKALDSMIENAKKFLDSAKNLTKDVNPEKDVFTQVEIESLAKVIDETRDWKKVEKAAQDKLKRNQNVRLTVKDITDKMALLDREVKYLVNKIKIWKPKPKPTQKPKKSDKKEAETNATEGSGKEEEQIEQPNDTESTPTIKPTVTENQTPHSEL